MFTYDTVTEAINGLRSRGYSIDFNLGEDNIYCSKPEMVLRPDEFEITEVYRFEGNTDPGDEAVVYAIESQNGLKGLLVNAYGPNADSGSSELVRKLTVHH